MGFDRLFALLRKTRLLAILATGERNCGGDPGRDWPYCIMNVRMLECLNVRMLECWNGGLEGLGGLEFRGKRCLSVCGAACKREEKFRACED